MTCFESKWRGCSFGINIHAAYRPSSYRTHSSQSATRRTMLSLCRRTCQGTRYCTDWRRCALRAQSSTLRTRTHAICSWCVQVAQVSRRYAHSLDLKSCHMTTVPQSTISLTAIPFPCMVCPDQACRRGSYIILLSTA